MPVIPSPGRESDCRGNFAKEGNMPKLQPKQSAIEMLTKQVEELKNQLEAMQQPQTQKRKVAKGAARPDVYYVLHGVPTGKMQPQAIACARILATASDVKHIPESEAMALIEAAHKDGRLKTTQDPWHIFQYYRPRLIEKDFLLMQTV